MTNRFETQSAIAWAFLVLAPFVVSADDTAESDAPPSRLLFVTQSVGYEHGSVHRTDGQLAPAEVALTQLGQQTGLFSVDCTQDCASDFTKENLANYDIVAFYTTLDLPIAEEDREYFFNEWAKQEGHGVLGFHSAGDTFHEYEPYWDMMGATFIGHPWNAGDTVTMTIHEPDNVLMQPFGSEFVIQDEIYMYRHWQPDKVHLLMSLNYAGSPTGSAIPTEHGYHVPVCWIKDYGDGHVYYNNLGHNETSWTNEAYLDSIETAIRWIRGEIEIDATPNPEVSAAQEEKSQADFAAGGFTRQ